MAAVVGDGDGGGHRRRDQHTVHVSKRIDRKADEKNAKNQNSFPDQPRVDCAGRRRHPGGTLVRSMAHRAAQRDIALIFLHRPRVGPGTMNSE